MPKKKTAAFEIFMNDIQRDEKAKGNFLQWGKELVDYSKPYWEVNLQNSWKFRLKHCLSFTYRI